MSAGRSRCPVWFLEEEAAPGAVRLRHAPCKWWVVHHYSGEQDKWEINWTSNHCFWLPMSKRNDSLSALIDSYTWLGAPVLVFTSQAGKSCSHSLYLCNKQPFLLANPLTNFFLSLIVYFAFKRLVIPLTYMVLFNSFFNYQRSLEGMGMAVHKPLGSVPSRASRWPHLQRAAVYSIPWIYSVHCQISGKENIW